MARRTALAGLDRAALAAPGDDPLVLSERAFLARILVRGRPEALAAAGAALGATVPEAVGGTARAGSARLLRLGPDRLVLVDAPDREVALLATLEAALAGLPGAVVDLSEAMATLRLEGPEAAVRAALAEGCPLDLHAAAFPVGRAAATVLGKVAIWLEAVEGGAGRLAVELHLDRSLAPHAARHLALAAREHGLVLPG